jgi:hypothetical protein
MKQQHPPEILDVDQPTIHLFVQSAANAVGFLSLPTSDSDYHNPIIMV